MIAKAMATPSRALADGASARALRRRQPTGPPRPREGTEPEKPAQAPRELRQTEQTRRAPASPLIRPSGRPAQRKWPPGARLGTPTGDDDAPRLHLEHAEYQLLDTEAAAGAASIFSTMRATSDHERSCELRHSRRCDRTTTVGGDPVLVTPEAHISYRASRRSPTTSRGPLPPLDQIEAPIPGRDVVGSRSPPHREIVGFKRCSRTLACRTQLSS